MTIIENSHAIDFNQKLNTASYVNVELEEDEEAVALMGLRVNLADQTVYPRSYELHDAVVNMIARLWHCPKPEDFAQYPNLVISSCLQAAWEKLFKYMDVEPRLIFPRRDTFTVDPEHVRAAMDERTIGVVCIMGNHYAGHYDPVWDVSRVVGIHVDAASGGFIAPFQTLPAWDFRLPNVLSISASGHKYGESCCGTGWIIWRERTNLSEHVATSVSYLGGKADSHTLNFSRPASGIYVQYYKFLLRPGRLPAGLRQHDGQREAHTRRIEGHDLEGTAPLHSPGSRRRGLPAGGRSHAQSGVRLHL